MREDGGGAGLSEPPANALAELLETKLELPLGRLKTGTPPRLDGTTIDWERCERQPSERPPLAFSFLNGEARPRGYVDCYRTNTNEATHKIVAEEARTLAPASTTGVGPRYCPSLYKKVERFPERTSHGVWLEPEGLQTDLVYPNGLSGAYPEEVQLKIVRSIRGLEDAVIVQPGYDVEYDFVDPTTLTHDLQLRAAPGLYLAGQICGTTGYEEAAALGVVAGANAGLSSTCPDDDDQRRRRRRDEKFILSRRDGYIGVLVDDLVTRGTTEPYRMFTSRAEHRLHLRADNADLRLTPKAYDVGLVDDERFERCRERQGDVASSLERLSKIRFPAERWYDAVPGLVREEDRKKRTPGSLSKSAADVLKMPRATLADVEKAARDLSSEVEEEPSFGDDARGGAGVLTKVPSAARDTVAAICKYGAYVDRQDRELETFKRNDHLFIPPDIDYSPASLPALSSEEREKLDVCRPKTLADASNISGITPASLVYLYNHVTAPARRRRQKKDDAVIR
mmetsp:Transcript_10764/g.35653  ORF Transcript_10764/g.35653 Transcript_10764/m.35653 type:complete len:511 (+) Transcript_10764:403-1935(+)